MPEHRMYILTGTFRPLLGALLYGVKKLLNTIPLSSNTASVLLLFASKLLAGPKVLNILTFPKKLLPMCSS